MPEESSYHHEVEYLRKRDSGLLTLPFALGVWFIDQLTKTIVSFLFTYAAPHEVTSFFNIFLIHNSGAAFSFLADSSGWQRWLFSFIALTATVVITYLLRKNSWHTRGMFCIGLTLVLGGALGNLTDRLLLGYVVDFLDFHAYGWHWPAFNIADIAIVIGGLALILEGFLTPSEEERITSFK